MASGDGYLMPIRKNQPPTYGLLHVRRPSGVPDIESDRHRLLIHGLGERPFIYTLDALGKYPTESHPYFLACTGNSIEIYAKEPPKAGVERPHGQISENEFANGSSVMPFPHLLGPGMNISVIMHLLREGHASQFLAVMLPDRTKQGNPDTEPSPDRTAQQARSFKTSRPVRELGPSCDRTLESLVLSETGLAFGEHRSFPISSI